MKRKLASPRADGCWPLAGIVLVLLLGRFSPAHATLRTWTGAGANAFWSTASNWSPAGAEDLSIPDGAPRRTSTNDLPLGMFGFILFNGASSDYELHGNGITLSGGLSTASSPPLGASCCSVHR